MNIVDKYNQLIARRSPIVVDEEIDVEQYPEGTVFYNLNTDSLYILHDGELQLVNQFL